MPTRHGGRFGLRLIEVAAEHAKYTLELSAADGQWSAAVAVSKSDGALTIDGWQGSGTPPAWLEQYARAALRDAWRAHGERGWPRRLQRWRAPPSARGERTSEGSDS
jgi:hypothetical protein